MRIAMVGAGGVGGYFGGRLAQAGHDVWLVARGRHLAALREGGLRVDSVHGDFALPAVQATDDTGEIGAVDAVIVTVKNWQLPGVVEAIRPLLAEHTAVIPLLNGVEAVDVLGEALGHRHVLGGLCRIAARVESPGHIVHDAIDPTIVFGEMDDRRSERALGILEAFSKGGFVAELASDIQVALWEKFMLIATWSGVGAVTRAPVGVWRSLQGSRGIAEQCLREILAIARARGVAVADERVEKTLAFIDSVGEGALASMQRDIMEGRPSELESQNGAVVRLGAEAGVPTPVNHFLYHVLLPQERAARG
ncbi:2-dehydropantoate 2-reductase [Gaopeijia maritima]|uniref:ketopantoate reductase family protein n=1 Tax=Gaopeijia maritima TaxID=3119007 RepID=UPI003248EED0